MGKTLIIALLLLLMATPALAGDKWTRAEKNKAFTYHMLNIMDWGQTLTIARNPRQFYEMNPIMGKHPSVGEVNSYFLVSTLSHLAISDYLSHEWRNYFINFTLTIKGLLVANNFSVGIRVGF